MKLFFSVCVYLHTIPFTRSSVSMICLFLLLLLLLMRLKRHSLCRFYISKKANDFCQTSDSNKDLYSRRRWRSQPVFGFDRIFYRHSMPKRFCCCINIRLPHSIAFVCFFYVSGKQHNFNCFLISFSSPSEPKHGEVREMKCS